MRYFFFRVCVTAIWSSVVSAATNSCPIERVEDIRGNTYDYIVVGAGIAGLVVANRLSEDNDRTVLVIERGYFDNKPEAIIPYYANGVDESVMMRPKSAPVANLNNATFNVAVPAVVGGGSVVNGMGYLRGSRADYDSWEELGNPGWGWDGIFPYFRKSTTITPPSPATVKQWNITWNPRAYDGGPLNIAIDDFYYPDLAHFWNAWKQETNVPKPRDSSDGTGPGVYWSSLTIDASLGVRATARKEYYDTVCSRRRNLHLLTGQTVNEILFRDLRATGVNIIGRADNKFSKVFAKKEVILAAGAVQTPQLLQVSGIGPKDVLKAAGIEVKKDMPAVGANLQDHPTVIMKFNLAHQSFPNPDSIANNATYNATVWAQYLANHTGPIASGRSGLGAFLSLPMISSSAGSIASKLRAQNPAQYLPSVYSYTPLLLGFRAQRDILARRFSSDRMGISGFPFTGSGLAPASFHKTSSRGTITLNLTNPHALPVVQYNTLMNPVDTDIILAMVKRARAFWERPELASLGPVEVAPGAQYQSDEDLLFALTQRGGLLPSLAHPSGTCAMMPEELGGVVGADLTVHGVRGLSVVDASILPMIPAAPLQATMYAVGEKAADIIKARG